MFQKKYFVMIFLLALVLVGCAGPQEELPATTAFSGAPAAGATETIPTTPVIVLTLPAPTTEPPATEPPVTEPETEPATEAATEPPVETTSEPTLEPPAAVPLVIPQLTEEEKAMLLKIAMAEVGQDNCSECAALVMCTVLNRVKSDRFGSSIRSVLYAENQYLPVMDGSFERAIPNYSCYMGLNLVMQGWDASLGALYYEFCEGESWHSQNLTKVTEHCNTRFYT